jgi:ketosteroid isomerase-like protein
MSSEQNIQIVQKCYADFQRGDVASIIGALDDRIVWSTPDVDLPTGGVRNGKAQVAEFFQAVAQTWDFQAFEPRDYIASGDMVAASGMLSATARSAGRAVSCDWAMVWKFQDGKVTHFQEYTDTAALRDAVAARAAA